MSLRSSELAGIIVSHYSVKKKKPLQVLHANMTKTFMIRLLITSWVQSNLELVVNIRMTLL